VQNDTGVSCIFDTLLTLAVVAVRSPVEIERVI